ncbi:hypothetical protein BGZ98_005280 [Dissophora globulifera]|nr:hypothetical protein BGZ98_005280 [Dissophora globulifera]
MAVNMSNSYGSPTDYEPYSHFAYQSSPQLDFTFYSPPHEGGSKDNPVPAATFNASLPDNIPSLGLTGEQNLDELLNMDEATTPRKRDRGERIVWTPEEDEYLRAAVQLYGDKTEKWAKIAACVPGRTNKNCRKRWFHSLDPKLKKGPWTEEEDQLLKTGVQMFKGQWSKIAERIPGRTDDQCAKRWREGLDPLIDRAAWTPEDDLLLLQRFDELGSQWQKIAMAFPGRPGLHCRNRWRKLQRGLNHMKRANKRRSQGGAGDHLAVISETRRLEALMDSQNDDMESDNANFNTAEDLLLMQDAFLDDEFALEHGIILERDGSITVANDGYGDQLDSNEPEDEKPYGCAVLECSFVSSSPSLLFYHFKASHAGAKVEKPFRCTMPGCETRKRYKNINGLQYHVTHAKNSAGHSTHGQSPVVDEGAESAKSGFASQQTASTNLNNLNNDTPMVSASAPIRELQIKLPPSAFDPSKITLSNPPTPAEIQLQLHQSKQDHPHPPVLPLLSHSAFNIQRSTSSLEGSVSSSQASSGASSPQIQRMFCRCPEAGCDQTYHQIQGLNVHMANSHSHRAMTMQIGTGMYGAEAMVIPQEDHIDFDMDMTDLVPGASTSMDSNMLLLRGSHLQHHVNSGEHMGMDSSPASAIQDRSNDATSSGSSASFGMLASKDFVFTGPLTSSLQRKQHFGTHFNVSARDTDLSQQAPMGMLMATAGPSGAPSGGISSAIEPSASTSKTTASSSSQPPKGAKLQSTRTLAKRFSCTAPNCQKSYAGAATLSNHIRNDHPEFYASAYSSSSATSAQRSLGSMDTPHSPETANKDDGDHTDKPYKCLVPGCGKGYTNIGGLKNHLLQTHGSTPKTSTAA